MREALQRRLGVIAAAIVVLLLVTGCHRETTMARRPPPPPVKRQPDTTTARVPAPRPLPPVMSTPSENDGEYGGKALSTEVGVASWYGPSFNHKNAANGEPFDQDAMTAAHRTLPMGTMVRVTNLATNQSAVVKITDRGPFVEGRVLDLSMGAAKATGVYRMGIAKVKIEVLTATAHAGLAGKWCVQVGAFANPDHAVRLKADMQRRYATAKVIEFPGPTGHWVRINSSELTQASATQMANAIRPAEPDARAFIVRLD